MKIFHDAGGIPDLRDPRTQFVIEIMAQLPADYELPKPGEWKDIDVTLTFNGSEVDVQKLLARMSRRPPEYERMGQEHRRLLEESRARLSDWISTLMGDSPAGAEVPAGESEREIWRAAHIARAGLNLLELHVRENAWQEAFAECKQVARVTQEIDKMLGRLAPGAEGQGDDEGGQAG